MVPAHFYKIAYADTTVELVEARVGLTSFGHVQTFYYNSEQPVNVSELLKSPEFWIIQIIIFPTTS